MSTVRLSFFQFPAYDEIQKCVPRSSPVSGVPGVTAQHKHRFPERRGSYQIRPCCNTAADHPIRVCGHCTPQSSRVRQTKVTGGVKMATTVPGGGSHRSNDGKRAREKVEENVSRRHGRFYRTPSVRESGGAVTGRVANGSPRSESDRGADSAQRTTPHSDASRREKSGLLHSRRDSAVGSILPEETWLVGSFPGPSRSLRCLLPKQSPPQL